MGFWGSTGVVAVGWGSFDGRAGVRAKMTGRVRRREVGWVREAGG